MSEVTNPLQFSADSQTISDIANRGLDTRREDRDQSPISVTLMGIDETIVEYLSGVIKPIVTDNGASRLVPVLYGTPERWATFRKDGVIRHESDKIQTPLLMIRRSGMTRGKLSNPVNKFVQMSWEPGWNRRNVYDKFSVLNNIRPSRQLHAIIIPDYIDITYDIILWTEYEEQMSELVGQIQVENDDYWGHRNGFKFRVKIDSFDNQSDIEAAGDRVIRTTFQMVVGAYLIPDKMIKNFHISPTTKKSYTAKKLVIMTEFDGTGTPETLSPIGTPTYLQK